MKSSNVSAYSEFPSSSLDPPLAKGVEGAALLRMVSSLERNWGDLERERKSLEEKSVEVWGTTVRRRRADLRSRLLRAWRKEFRRVILQSVADSSS